jgi:hypothetical protein
MSQFEKKSAKNENLPIWLNSLKLGQTGNNLIIVFPASESLVGWLVTSWLGPGNTLTFFYSALNCVPVFKETLFNKLSLTWA